MMKKYFFILMIFHLQAFSQAPVVENVHFDQRTDGTLIVDIYYDVIDPNQDVMDIRIEASADSSRTWDLPCSHLTGDVGYGVLSGTGKHVVWDFYKDNPDTSSGGYCIRVIAENNVVVDIDGNRYRTVQIGNQIWMAENLKVTHYRNGDEIPNITDYSQWSETSSGALCAVENNPVYTPVYGLLYNWYSVKDVRGIAPDGWHVPSEEDWIELAVQGLGMSYSEATLWYGRSYWGSSISQAGKLKETGTEHWRAPNSGATDETGFTARPAGGRAYTGYFYDLKQIAGFWTSKEYGYKYAFERLLSHNNSLIYLNDVDKHYGLSVRCIRNIPRLRPPELSSPSDGSSGIQSDPVLSWKQLNYAISYDIEVSRNANFTDMFIAQMAVTTTSFNMTDLSEGLTYYWRVRGTDSNGNQGAWSDAWDFTIIGPVLPVPLLISPADSSLLDDDRPVFVWDNIPGVHYELQVDDSIGFNSPEIGHSDITISTYTAAGPLADAVYFWRVRCLDELGNWSAWSETGSFTVPYFTPAKPTLTLPVNGSSINGNTPLFDWNDAPGIFYYKLQVDNDSGFDHPEIEHSDIMVSTYTAKGPLPDGTYYWRVRGRDNEWNSGEWSEVWTFQIKSYDTGTMTDIDGNTYQTVKIGNQWWMAENLKVTHYRNGDQIPDETNNPDWVYLTTGAYCTYNNKINDEINGYLYNWYAVNDSRNIAPPGWHVPTSAEWAILSATLGEVVNRGGKLKATGSIENGTGLWHLPNTGASDEVGFSALPAGWCYDGTVSKTGYNAYFWSATDAGHREDDDLENFWDICERGWAVFLYHNYSSFSWYDYCQFMGFSVRLVKD